MASIGTGSAEGGRRAVDHEIPLVPFIDLLLCCIMFLLVTAVWNQLSAIPVSTSDGSANGIYERPPGPQPLNVRVSASGYHLFGEAGDETTIPRAGESYDVAGLRDHLASRRQIAPNERDVVVSADDGVVYSDIVVAMDTLLGSGFERVSVSGT